MSMQMYILTIIAITLLIMAGTFEIFVCWQRYEREKSYKAEASVEYVKNNDKWVSVDGSIYLYFNKDSSKPNINLGSNILILNNVYPIINSGNPGGFDYAKSSCRLIW